MFKKAIFSLLIIIPTFLFSGGVISDITGKAYIKNGSSYKPAKKGSKILNGNLVRTTSKAYVIITFDDASKLKVFPKSMIKIDKQTIGKSSQALTLFSGKLWAKVTKKLTKKNYFRITTPTSTAGVRGTDFGVVVSENGSTMVKVKSGAVNFESDLDPKLEEQDKIDAKGISNVEEDPLKNFMNDGSLHFSVAKINREDSSIDVDDLTGVSKKSILLKKDDSGSFRLSKGLESEDLSAEEFAKAEKMPEDKSERDKIITWHISNLNKRLKKADHMVFKVTKIAGNIDGMMSDKKFNTIDISSSTRKGKRELVHIADELNNIQSGMDAQLYFLENHSDAKEAKELIEKTKKTRAKTDKIMNDVQKLQ